MKKVNNKILVAAFIGLAAIFVLTKLFRSPARESNLDVNALKIDTAALVSISIFSEKDSAIEIQLKRGNNRWTATRKNITADVPRYKMTNLLDVLASLRPERIVARKKEKWPDYKVTDSLATKLVLKDKSSTLMTLYIGKEDAGISYVRIDGKNDVLAVAASLTSSVKTNFSSWRDQTFLKLTKNKLNEIQFNYPADSGFVIRKVNKLWMAGSTPLDSVKVDKYLSKWNYREHSLFADNVTISRQPDVTIIFKSKEADDVVVKAWKYSFYQWVLNSSIQPTVNFLDEGSVLSRDLMIGKKAFH